MTREEAMIVLTKELKCNSLDECNLKCDECGMCIDSKDLMEAYEMAIIALARPKGKWLPSCIPDSILSKCSNCGFDTGAWSFNYCPYCGAEMKDQKILNQIAKAGGTIDDAKELINKCHSKNKDLCVSIDNLELSVRSYNCLKRSGYNNIIDLVGVTMSDLMTIRNLGRKSLKEIVDKLNEWDITVIND